MKTSVGYTVILNIVIIFIVIVFGVIAMCLSYYRSFKVSNVITHSIEKYEGYNYLAENEIVSKISALGYGSTSVKCPQTRSSCTLVKSGENSIQYSEGKLGYCVYECPLNDDQYYYKTTTNMLMNIPFINNILNIPVESNSRKLYGFSELSSTEQESLCVPQKGGSNYSIGDQFKCQNVDERNEYSGIWYLLEDNATTISLIYSRNFGFPIHYDGAELFLRIYFLPSSNVTVSLPTQNQLSKVCKDSCEDSRFTKCGTAGEFLKVNLNGSESGYWAQNSEGEYAWNINQANNCELNLDSRYVSSYIGIRPVITIPKSSIGIKK